MKIPIKYSIIMDLMFLLKLLYAIIGIAMGVGILRYRKIVYSWTGRFYWAEKYLGSGGTITVISLTALGLIMVSVAYPLGAFDKETSIPWGPTQSQSK